jgi:RyR domain
LIFPNQRSVMKANKEVDIQVAVIAKVCHEANRAYCQATGDPSQPIWAEAPQWQKDSAINGVLFHLKTLAQGSKPLPSASHENWLKQKAEEGWTYGPVKDAEKKEHPCFLPYTLLPVGQKLKDFIFCAIVEAFYEANAKTLVTQ